MIQMIMIVILSLITKNKTPPIMMIMTVLQAMLISLQMWINLTTPWFSFILILVFLGGMMILFTYICSLNMNQITKNKFSTSSTMMLLMMMLIIMYNKTNHKNESKNEEMMFNKMMTLSTSTVNMMMMMFLLMALMVSIKMIKNKTGPMRAKKN